MSSTLCGEALLEEKQGRRGSRSQELSLLFLWFIVGQCATTVITEPLTMQDRDIDPPCTSFLKIVATAMGGGGSVALNATISLPDLGIY